jgi:hypothetical protein
VHEVWYFRENAGIAEVFGTDANITQRTITTAVILAKILVSRTRLFMTDPPHLPLKLASCLRIHIPGFELLSIVEYGRYPRRDAHH